MREVEGRRENKFLICSVAFMETGLSKPMHWDNPEGWDGVGLGGGLGMGDTCTPVTGSCQCIAETTTIL